MTDNNSAPELRFAEWFRKNYPGPDTIIGDPDWHAPKIFRAAIHAARKPADLCAADRGAPIDVLPSGMTKEEHRLAVIKSNERLITDNIRLRAELAALQPTDAGAVAVRHSFDGHGWQYADCGSGSDWLGRFMKYPDAEQLYDAAPPADNTALVDAARAIADHDLFCDREYLSNDLNAKLDALRAALASREAPPAVTVAETPTAGQLYDACMSYRHDFGLLEDEQRKSVEWQAREWWRCIIRALPLTDPADALAEHDRAVRADERVKCAEVASAETGWDGVPYMSQMQYGPGIGKRIAAAILARGEQEGGE